MAISDSLHPYYPVGVVIPGYVASTRSTSTILAVFATTIGAILLPTYLAIRHIHSSLRPVEVAIALWFVVCGFVHLVVEGHFAPHTHHLSSLSDVLAEAWKENSLSDSRYLTLDNFVVCMEIITAIFWDPYPSSARTLSSPIALGDIHYSLLSALVSSTATCYTMQHIRLMRLFANKHIHARRNITFEGIMSFSIRFGSGFLPIYLFKVPGRR